MFDLQVGEQRLRLRGFQGERDLNDVLMLHSDPETASLMSIDYIVPPGPKLRETYKKNIEENSEMFCIVEVSVDGYWMFVGFVGLFGSPEARLRRESAYAIGIYKDYWNKGYGTAVTKFVVRYAFENLFMHRIWLGTVEGNDRAIAVYQKCGFIVEGSERGAVMQNGKWKDIIKMSMLIDDWNARGADARGIPDLEAPEEGGPVDETGVNPKHIEIVIQQTYCSRAKAVRLRAFRTSPTDDLEGIQSLFNNAEVAPLITERFVIPRGPKLKDDFKGLIETETEIFCTIETTPPRTETEGTGEFKPEFVGFTALWAQPQRGQRHSKYSIVLSPKFWNKGYGKVITKFMVDYAFLNLNMHRISLEVYEGNDRAAAKDDKEKQTSPMGGGKILFLWVFLTKIGMS
ncbi:hypothetical protein CVT26_009988 [Gymnopilus dilepis]|uniref:N-acetyltransferase domain-containing protein n=1 Tax=Gymnopilus dilepis TaxID=231916 RepID=A0A409VL43_9AGAR|nr:hypothetical protein CVT26_009988 [Gymnopilus dilepis]